MICVINPDGTITCSDGDGGYAADLTEIATFASNGSRGWEAPATDTLGQVIKVAQQLRDRPGPAVVLVVDAALLSQTPAAAPAHT